MIDDYPFYTEVDLSHTVDTTPIIICDLDGTAALMDNRIKDRDEQVKKDGSNKNKWNAFNRGFGLEPVNYPVLSTLHAFKGSQPCEIVYLSGRSEEFRQRTDEWLGDNHFPLGELYMRPKGDYRRDDIFKKELSGNIDLVRVLLVLDDRDQVVKMWRDMGLTCFQVNYGDF